MNTVEFTYDSKNRVVKRSTNGVPLFLIYDGWSLIEERNGSGALLQKYINGAVVDEILVKVSTTGSIYYHQDGLGSITQLTDSTGAVVEKYSYDIFGKATIASASGIVLPATLQGNRFLFTGREWISEVGLYDYRNRVYSCELGRFLQTDPIRFDGKDINIYRYCGNNGVNCTDSLGLWSFSLCPENKPSKGLSEPLAWDPNAPPPTPTVPPKQRGNNNNTGDSGIDNGDGTKTYKNENKHYSEGSGNTAFTTSTVLPDIKDYLKDMFVTGPKNEMNMWKENFWGRLDFYAGALGPIGAEMSALKGAARISAADALKSTPLTALEREALGASDSMPGLDGGRHMVNVLAEAMATRGYTAKEIIRELGSWSGGGGW